MVCVVLQSEIPRCNGDDGERLMRMFCQEVTRVHGTLYSSSMIVSLRGVVVQANCFDAHGVSEA